MCQLLKSRLDIFVRNSILSNGLTKKLYDKSNDKQFENVIDGVNMTKNFNDIKSLYSSFNFMPLKIKNMNYRKSA